MVIGQVGRSGQIVLLHVVVGINLELEHVQILPHNTTDIYARLMDHPTGKIKLVTRENVVSIHSIKYWIFFINF